MGDAVILIDEMRIFYGGPYDMQTMASTAGETAVLVRLLVEDLMDADSASTDPLRIKIAGTGAGWVKEQLATYFRPEECVILDYSRSRLIYEWCLNATPISTVGDFRFGKDFGFLIITPSNREEGRLNVSVYRIEGADEDLIRPGGNTSIDKVQEEGLVTIANWQARYDIANTAIISPNVSWWIPAGIAINEERGINVALFEMPDLYELLQQAKIPTNT